VIFSFTQVSGRSEGKSSNICSQLLINIHQKIWRSSDVEDELDFLHEFGVDQIEEQKWIEGDCNDLKFDEIE